MTYNTDVAVLAVFIPRKEVHADIVDSEFGIMLEESVDIFAGSGIFGHSPVEPQILGRGIHDISGMIVIEIAESIVGARYLSLAWAVNPQRIVVNAYLEALGTAFFHQLLERHRAVVCHVARCIVGEHGYETVGTHHIIAIRLEIFRNPVDYLVPFGGSDIHIFVGHTVLLLLIAVLVDAPVKRSLIGVYILNHGQLRQFVAGRIFHLVVIVVASRQEAGPNGKCSHSTAYFEYIFHFFCFDSYSFSTAMVHSPRLNVIL